MRKQLLGMVLAAGLIGIFTGPALAEGTKEEPAATVAVQRVSVPGTGIRDEAAMVLVGTALIGLAAAVRRAA